MSKDLSLTERLSSFIREFRFRTKITLSIIGILLIFGIAISFIIGRFISKAMLQEKKSKGISLSVMLASRAVEPILSHDYLNLRNLTDEAVRLNRDISYAFMLDSNNEVLTHTFKDGFPEGLINVNMSTTKGAYNIRLITNGFELIDDIAVPILISGNLIGTVRIGISHTEAEMIVSRMRWVIYLITAFGIAAGALIAALFSKTVTFRVKQLHAAAKEVIKGNLDTYAQLYGTQPCWGIKDCHNTECPAFGDNIKKCWYIAGTKCPECSNDVVQNTFDRCKDCIVYKRNSGDEIQELTDFFNIMVYTQKDRIEELKRTEDRLQHQQQLLKMILDVTPDFVSLQDTSMRYVAVNRAFCSLIGREESDIIGKTDLDMLPKEQAEANMQDNRVVIASGSSITREFEVPYKNQSRWFHIVRIPVRNSSGDITGLLCSSRDITEIKELYSRLARAQQLETIGQLAAGVAHEINTPLGIILGYAQLMLEDLQAGTEEHNNLLIIEKYTRICKKIVSDLLHFSRHTDTKKESLSVNRLVEQVATLLGYTFSLERVFIRRFLSHNIPDVYGDSDKLEQVLMNILRNAFDAIGSDGVITVTTGFEEEQDMVVITISDTGLGIKPEHRDRVFNPFFSTKSVGKGTGLGLSVTLGIVQDHGGSIDFESPPTSRFKWMEHGDVPSNATMFIIRLPAAGKRTSKEAADGKDISP